jgi:iron complex transport system substrate-binding protein
LRPNSASSMALEHLPMRRFSWAASGGFIALLASLLVSRVAFGQGSPCSRVVSLAPSVTELLFDLDLGSSVVGVTRFCRYPSAARGIAHVGGMFDLNVEQIVALRPTHVFALAESEHQVELLKRFGITVVIVDHRRVDGILESYRAVGAHCAVQEAVSRRIEQFEREERTIKARCANPDEAHTPLQTMVVVGRSGNPSAHAELYISGSDGFYSDVLRLVGARNVHTTKTVAVPTLSAEGLLKLNPDVILEVVQDNDELGAGLGDSNRARRRSFWNRFGTLKAVSHNKVFILDDDFASIPGPRYIELARKLSGLLCR